LGDATRLQIWKLALDGFELVEERPAPDRGGGMQRWQALAELLPDCRAFLVSGIGDTPRKVLKSSGILSVEVSGLIEAGLHNIFYGNPSATR
jgi:nitrogen fixation protein NifB